MYEAHPVFEPPDDEHVRVWRYTDYTKFVSMLETSSIYFPRADLLADPKTDCGVSTHVASFAISASRSRNVLIGSRHSWVA